MSAAEQARNLLGLAFSMAPEDVPADASITRTARWDSLAHLNLIIALEQELGRTLDTDTLLGIESLTDIARLLEACAD